MTEKFKESVDKGSTFGAILTDLSKAFDCNDHRLSIDKLTTFRFAPLSLKLIYSYLAKWTQQIKSIKVLILELI